MPPEKCSYNKANICKSFSQDSYNVNSKNRRIMLFAPKFTIYNFLCPRVLAIFWRAIHIYISTNSEITIRNSAGLSPKKSNVNYFYEVVILITKISEKSFNIVEYCKNYLIFTNFTQVITLQLTERDLVSNNFKRSFLFL